VRSWRFGACMYREVEELGEPMVQSPSEVLDESDPSADTGDRVSGRVGPPMTEGCGQCPLITTLRSMWLEVQVAQTKLDEQLEI